MWTKSIEHLMMEMFYGVVPLKIKEIVLVDTPWWMNALLRLMRLFISSKMSERMHNLTLSSMHERMGGAELLPSGVLGGTGEYVPRYAFSAMT